MTCRVKGTSGYVLDKMPVDKPVYVADLVAVTGLLAREVESSLGWLRSRGLVVNDDYSLRLGLPMTWRRTK